MSNYINKVAKMLNLELGQEFIVTDIVGKVFWFTKATLMSIDENHNTGCANHKILGMILDGTVAINILPHKPQINEVYYVPNLSAKCLYSPFRWANDEFDILHYRRGLVCKTAKEAKKLAKRLFVQIKELRDNG